MPDETPPTRWARVKGWAWLMVKWNARKYLAYLVTVLLPVLIYNWTNDPAEPDKPLPAPPLPDWVRPPDGWRPPTDEERSATFQALQTPRYRNTEAGSGHEVRGDADYLVYRPAAKGRGRPIGPKNQLDVGSCVSFGSVDAGEMTAAAQVGMQKLRQDLPDFVQEVNYAGGRVEANGGRVPFRGDGSTGAWQAKWLETTGGFLPRGVYGQHDLTAYDTARCRQWGDRGVPDELEPECRKHKARCTLVSTTTEAKSALSQGYAIFVCSGVGFDSNKDGSGRPTRDAEGFLKAAGSWAHCMSIVAYRGDRPGFLLKNSWGPGWVVGPKGKFDDIPDGSFWADEATVQRMLLERDSYAVANADGFRRRKIEPADWIIRGERPAPLLARNRGIDHAFALSP